MNQTIETTVKGKNVITKDEQGNFNEFFVLLQGRVSKSQVEPFVPEGHKIINIHSATATLEIPVDEAKIYIK